MPMSLYCDARCLHLDADRNRCKKWGKRLSCKMRIGIVSYKVWETCGECRASPPAALEKKKGWCEQCPGYTRRK